MMHGGQPFGHHVVGLNAKSVCLNSNPVFPFRRRCDVEVKPECEPKVVLFSNEVRHGLRIPLNLTIRFNWQES